MMYGLDSRNHIDLSTYQEIKTQTSSKGNQSKFYQQGYWVKLDFMGYESLAEVIASELIQLTNIPPELHLPYGLAIYEGEGQQQYRYMPIFDNGLSLGSDTTFTMGTPAQMLVRKIKAKPFDTSFKRQLNAVQFLYGATLQIDVDLANLKDRIRSLDWYSTAVRERVIDLLCLKLA